MTYPPSVMLGFIQRANERKSPSPPRDCVKQFPTLNPDTLELVGFDAHGVPRIKVEIPRDEDVAEWCAWLLRWVRRRDRDSVKASMTVIS